MVSYPKTGQAVAQRSETGQRILGAKEGKGMWVWSAVVLAVLSSRMSPAAAPWQVSKLEVYYESIKREPKIRGIKKCRCDERLQTKTKEFTRLPYTGLVWELEHLKIETRLISERFPKTMGECEN